MKILIGSLLLATLGFSQMASASADHFTCPEGTHYVSFGGIGLCIID